MSLDTPTLSVVLASVESGRSLGRALPALLRSIGPLSAELLVVDASQDDSAAQARHLAPQADVVSKSPGTLVPALWGEGIRRSKGRFVALTTGHCIVSDGWASALVAALQDGAGAAGAGIVPAADASALDRAICYLRYAAFLDLTRGESRPARELPADNAAYVGDDVRAWVADRDDEFWEVGYHRWLRDRGQTIVAVPAATAQLGPSFPLGVILRHRFRHGRHFGRWRVREGGQARLRVIAAAPLVPAALLVRAGRSAARTRGHGGSFARAALPLLVLAAAWAAGEAAGAADPAARHEVPG